MKIVRWIIVAFSMYSRIPMPVFPWKDEDMSGGIMFLPLIGALIGALSLGLYQVAVWAELPTTAAILLLGLIPVFVTGGFHMDGFMDVTDALRSYQSKEKKLEIMKDPHTGAFAIIGLVKVVLLWGLGLDLLLEKGNTGHILCYGCIFVMMRAAAGITSVLLQKARKNGMLYEETKKTNLRTLVVLSLQLAAGIGVACWANRMAALLLLGALPVLVIYYRSLTYGQFGGVTGDTAGYFITLGETILTVVLGIAVWCGI